MVTIDIVYESSLRTQATHRPSGSALTTDAPVDNHGRGEAFSPTDLLATSLGTCMITVMGIAARKHEIALDGTRVTVHKTMTTSPPRKVARLEVLVEAPAAVAKAASSAQRAALEHAGETCPVRLSLHPEVEVVTRYVWGG